MTVLGLKITQLRQLSKRLLIVLSFLFKRFAFQKRIDTFGFSHMQFAVSTRLNRNTELFPVIRREPLNLKQPTRDIAPV